MSWAAILSFEHQFEHQVREEAAIFNNIVRQREKKKK